MYNSCAVTSGIVPVTLPQPVHCLSNICVIPMNAPFNNCQYLVPYPEKISSLVNHTCMNPPHNPGMGIDMRKIRKSEKRPKTLQRHSHINSETCRQYAKQNKFSGQGIVVKHIGAAFISVHHLLSWLVPLQLPLASSSLPSDPEVLWHCQA